MGQQKTRPKYVFKGFGFPVELRNIPMAKMGGEWVMDINYFELQEVAALALALAPNRLSGNHVRFLREHLKMSRVKFGKLLGVTQPCVTQWEQFGDKATGMNLSTEQVIRLKVLSESNLSSEEFELGYRVISSAQLKAKPAFLRMSLDKALDRKKMLAEHLEPIAMTGA